MTRILIMEDQASVRAMLADVLEDAGYDVREAADGQAGLDLLQKSGADLVITDILMPGRDGLETIVELRRKYGHLPILAMSGGGRLKATDYLEVARKLGADETIAKPFTPEQLLQAVAGLLGVGKA